MGNDKEQIGRFRTWVISSSILRVIEGFMPTFIDGDSRILTTILDDKMQPCTDGKTIWVSLIPDALKESYSFEDWLILLQAVAAHEAQHVNSSNFDDIVQIRKWYGAYLKDHFGLDTSVGGPIAKNALNIIEDGRIEAIIVRRRKGLYLPLRFLNQIIQDGTTIEPFDGGPKKEYEDFWAQVLSYAKTGLYAPGIKFYENSELENAFLSVSDYIDQGVLAKSSAECCRLTEELLIKVAPYLAKLLNQSAELQKQISQDSSDEYTSNDGKPDDESGDAGDSISNGNPLRAPSPTKQGGHGQGQGQGKDKQKSQMGFSNARDEGEPISNEEMDAARKLMSEQLSAAKDAERKKPVIDGDGLDAKSLAAIRASYTGRTTPINSKVLSSNYRDKLPMDLATQSAMLRREIIRITERRKQSQQGLRHGVLDQNVLWKFGVQEDSLFYRKGAPSSGKCAISLLIDNSSSMNERIGRSSKSALARSAAAIIEEAASGIVPLKVTLFDQTGGGVNHTTIRGFDLSSKENQVWNSIRAINPRGCNRDSVHIRIATEELLRRREQKKVLIVLSDGLPSAYSSRTAAQAEVLDAVRAARRKGVIVIPIMFGEANFLVSSRASYMTMYEKNIIACQPSEITSSLAALFRQVVLR